MSDLVHVGPCYRCKCDMTLPRALYEAAKKSSRIEFYCPYGHSQIFAEGESEETKLRRERDRLQQRLAEKDDTISRLEREKSAQRGQVTKLRNRVSKSVCPCCTRSFTDLRRHMATKHPEFAAEAAE